MLPAPRWAPNELLSPRIKRLLTFGYWPKKRRKQIWKFVGPPGVYTRRHTGRSTDSQTAVQLKIKGSKSPAGVLHPAVTRREEGPRQALLPASRTSQQPYASTVSYAKTSSKVESGYGHWTGKPLHESSRYQHEPIHQKSQVPGVNSLGETDWLRATGNYIDKNHNRNLREDKVFNNFTTGQETIPPETSQLHRVIKPYITFRMCNIDTQSLANPTYDDTPVRLRQTTTI